MCINNNVVSTIWQLILRGSEIFVDGLIGTFMDQFSRITIPKNFEDHHVTVIQSSVPTLYKPFYLLGGAGEMLL